MVSKYISAENLSLNVKSQVVKIRVWWEIINASLTHLFQANRISTTLYLYGNLVLLSTLYVSYT